MIDRNSLRVAGFIAHYAAAGEVRAAAVASGLSERTCYRLLQDPAVLSQVEDRRAAKRAEIGYQVLENAREAVLALNELLTDWTACQSNPFARLSAIRIALQTYADYRVSELMAEIVHLRQISDPLAEPEPAEPNDTGHMMSPLQAG